MENLNTAFDVAEKYLDIPRMLDPEGITFGLKFHNPSVFTRDDIYGVRTITRVASGHPILTSHIHIKNTLISITLSLYILD